MRPPRRRPPVRRERCTVVRAPAPAGPASRGSGAPGCPLRGGQASALGGPALRPQPLPARLPAAQPRRPLLVQVRLVLWLTIEARPDRALSEDPVPKSGRETQTPPTCPLLLPLFRSLRSWGGRKLPHGGPRPATLAAGANLGSAAGPRRFRLARPAGCPARLPDRPWRSAAPGPGNRGWLGEALSMQVPSRPAGRPPVARRAVGPQCCRVVHPPGS